MSPMLQRQGQGGMAATPDLETSINQARGGGMPLAENLQRSMGKAMGADFSGVKVHTDSQSDQLNKSIQARAFTTGQDVFFRQGSYEPSSRGGQELIAHELTHVVQQTGTIQRYHTKHKDFRTSDDGQIAVHQKNSVGGQTAYATPALIKDASAKLKDVGTWNFHWAGVIMKSGSDTMTLENYSVGDYTKENKDWVFQMYGVGKKGQSFHEEHKDVHKQHGDAPTSLVAVRPKSQEE
jgi:hypothetical protein